MKHTINKLSRPELNQKTEFNNWSITYLREIFQCSKCKKRNTITCSVDSEERKINFQNCMYCGNPNYIKK
jgi:transcription elongation factor Elf1